MGRQRFASTGGDLDSSCAAPTSCISSYTDSLTFDLAQNARAAIEQCQRIKRDTQHLQIPTGLWRRHGLVTLGRWVCSTCINIWDFSHSFCLFILQIFFLLCSHSLHFLCWTDSQGVAFLQVQCCNSSEMLVTILSVLKCSQDDPFKRTVT